jgi:hypothetical protein
VTLSALHGSILSVLRRGAGPDTTPVARLPDAEATLARSHRGARAPRRGQPDQPGGGGVPARAPACGSTWPTTGAGRRKGLRHRLRPDPDGHADARDGRPRGDTGDPAEWPDAGAHRGHDRQRVWRRPTTLPGCRNERSPSQAGRSGDALLQAPAVVARGPGGGGRPRSTRRRHRHPQPARPGAGPRRGLRAQEPPRPHPQLPAPAAQVCRRPRRRRRADPAGLAAGNMDEVRRLAHSSRASPG